LRFGSILNWAAFGKDGVLCVHLFEPYVTQASSKSSKDVAEDFDQYFRKDLFRTADGAEDARMIYFRVTRWHSEPFSFGSYSEYSTLRPEAQQTILKNLRVPHAQVVFWAGEHTADANGTVVGAYNSGLRAGKEAYRYLKCKHFPDFLSSVKEVKVCEDAERARRSAKSGESGRARVTNLRRSRRQSQKVRSSFEEACIELQTKQNEGNNLAPRVEDGVFDVIVIGAGVAGLRAASFLRERSISTAPGCTRRLRVLHLEARGRIGGRVHSEKIRMERFNRELGTEDINSKECSGRADAMNIDLGANYIHGYIPKQSRTENDTLFSAAERAHIEVAFVDTNVWEPIECAVWRKDGRIIDTRFVLLVIRLLRQGLEKLRRLHKRK
jgi:hypothetical protein